MRISTVSGAVVGAVLSVAAAAVASTVVQQDPPPTPTVSALAEGDGGVEAPEPEPEPTVSEEEEVDATAPIISISSPRPESRFDEATIRVVGETEPGARVTIGDRPADVGAEGAWAIVLELAPGLNEIEAVATDEAGNAARAAVTVTYEQPEPEPAPEPAPKPKPAPEPAPKPKPAPEPAPKPAPDTGFTATQKHATVEYDPPYNYYAGTGTPGTKVKVWSEYGSAYAKVSEHGKWETKVWFETAPYGTHTWRVVAIHGDQERAFEFTGVRAEKQPEHELTANQQHEVNEHEPPYNVYWGTATPNGKVKVWSEYGHVWTEVNGDGKWETKLWFEGAPRGEHTWTVKVFHNEQVRKFQMTGIRPGEQQADVAFTANQQYGSCNEPVPYDVFHGTAKPGSLVRIESRYGQGTFEVGPKGHWEGKVTFPEAPRGETFEVHVLSKATGEVKVFTFTATEPETPHEG